MLLQLPLVPVLDAGKLNRQTVLESILFGVVCFFFFGTYSSNGLGLYLYRKGVMCSYSVQQESEQKGVEVLKFSPAWPVGIRCWYGFSASFVPKCDATCVVGMQLVYICIKHSPG